MFNYDCYKRQTSQLVVVQDTLIIYRDTGKVELNFDTIKITAKPKIFFDTVYINNIAYITEYAFLDTNVTTGINVRQLDSLNNIDTAFTINLRAYLYSKYNITDNMLTTGFKIADIDIFYNTQYINKIVYIKENDFLDIPIVRYGLPSAIFIGGVYVGSKIK